MEDWCPTTPKAQEVSMGHMGLRLREMDAGFNDLKVINEWESLFEREI